MKKVTIIGVIISLDPGNNPVVYPPYVLQLYIPFIGDTVKYCATKRHALGQLLRGTIVNRAEYCS